MSEHESEESYSEGYFSILWYNILYTWYTIVHYYENYGWYILAAVILLVYVYVKKIQPHLQRYLKRREDEIYDAKYHKDPDMVVARLNDQQEKIARLQEKYKKDAEIYKLKQEEKDAKKKEEWLKNQTETASGSRLGSSSSVKNDFNPLMGDNTRGYKAPKRKTCGGGGCG